MFYSWVFMGQKEIQLLVITVSFVFLTIMVFLFVLFFYFQKKRTQYLLEKMESELHFQSELVKTQIEIKDQTLSEISKELHDNIGQILSVAIMQVNMYSHNEEKKISQNELQELKGILSKSLDEIRVLSKIINRDNTERLDFVSAIEMDFERIQKLKKIDCELIINGTVPSINPEHELIIYRIFQEAVHNILRHSHSEHIVMSLQCSPEILNVKLTDQGIGFEADSKNAGLGLQNMQSRALLIGAELTIDSNPDGTTVQLHYPVKDEEDE